MSINDLLQKIKPFYTILLVLVICGIIASLVKLSMLESGKTGIKISYPNAEMASLVLVSTQDEASKGVASSLTQDPSSAQSGEVIGSKSGKKYYFPWCGTVKRIKPENQVHFKSIEEAKKAGFTPGGNCKGLK